MRAKALRAPRAVERREDGRIRQARARSSCRRTLRRGRGPHRRAGGAPRESHPEGRRSRRAHARHTRARPAATAAPSPPPGSGTTSAPAGTTAGSSVTTSTRPTASAASTTSPSIATATAARTVEGSRRFASPRYGITTSGTRRRLRGARGAVRARARGRPLAHVEPVRPAKGLGDVGVGVARVEDVVLEVAADLDLAERRVRDARERLGGKLRLRRPCSA